MTGDERDRSWQFYEGPGGGAGVKKELARAKLTTWESARLRDAMERVRTGTTRPGDVDHIRGDLYEVRVTGTNRRMRLFYGAVGRDAVLLALHFLAKKDQRRASDAIRLAQQRLSAHSELVRKNY